MAEKLREDYVQVNDATRVANQRIEPVPTQQEEQKVRYTAIKRLTDRKGNVINEEEIKLNPTTTEEMFSSAAQAREPRYGYTKTLQKIDWDEEKNIKNPKALTPDVKGVGIKPVTAEDALRNLKKKTIFDVARGDE